MNERPLVSIIINNYNYGRFLAVAIDSALSQTHPATEVIVVDDGSTDESRDVIAGYSGRIIPVLQENRGQASAFNAGFARSGGPIVFFLDADDRLLPQTAERVAEIFRANPGIARVQYRLAVVDAAGTPTGEIVPARYARMPSGDLRHALLQYNNFTWWPPTSGHAFGAWTLRKILPMPEQDFRVAADYYLVRANTLCGPIVSLDEVCGQYRFHGANDCLQRTLSLEHVHRQIVLIRDAHGYLRKFAASLDLTSCPPQATDMLDMRYIALRLTSLKLDRHRHPMPEDTLLSLCGEGIKAAWGGYGMSWPFRLLLVGWCAATALSPPLTARWLAEKYFHPETRKRFSRLLGNLSSEWPERNRSGGVTAPVDQQGAKVMKCG